MTPREIRALRDSHTSIQLKNTFFKTIQQEYTTQGTPLELHGLALVRFLMHQHPTKRPFCLKKTKITYVSSSINVIDDRLLFDIAYSFIPQFPFESRHLSKELSEQISGMFDVVFPSQEYVQNSTFGPENANCIFLDFDRFHSRKFKKNVIAKFEGNGAIKNNGRAIPHLKVCVVSNNGYTVNDDTIIYIGSHNMT